MSPIDRREFLLGSGAGAALLLTPELAHPAAPRAQGAPLPVAVIGAGRQGRAMLTELLKFESVRVAAVCEPDPSRLESALKKAPGAAGCANLDVLFENTKDLGAVFVATPTQLHREPALRALERGIAVYCEAPLAHSLEDAQAIFAGASQSKAVFACGLQGRSNPIYQLARTFLRSGSLSSLVALRAQHHKKGTWRSTAATPEFDAAHNWRLEPEHSLGLAGEWGVHSYDVFHWYLGEYPSTVRGSGAVRLHQDGRKVPDTVALDFGFPSGLRLHYSASLANSFEGSYELFQGSMATLKLAWTAGWMFKEADSPTQGWEVYANRQQFHDESGITLIADATKLAAQNKLKDGVGLPEPTLWYAMADFLKSVQEAKPVVCDAAEALRAARVAQAAARAVASGAEQTLDPAWFVR